MRRLLRLCLNLSIAIALTSCATHHKWESWDQEHLKAHDAGCPVAVFIAPGGDLEQC